MYVRMYCTWIVIYSQVFLHLALLPFPAVAALCHSDLPDLPNVVQLVDAACENVMCTVFEVCICTYVCMYVHVCMYNYT